MPGHYFSYLHEFLLSVFFLQHFIQCWLIQSVITVISFLNCLSDSYMMSFSKCVIFKRLSKYDMFRSVSFTQGLFGI